MRHIMRKHVFWHAVNSKIFCEGFSFVKIIPSRNGVGDFSVKNILSIVPLYRFIRVHRQISGGTLRNNERRNGQITLSITNISKSCLSWDFLPWQICLLPLFAKISEFTVCPDKGTFNYCVKL